ncbi:MAG: hypothetical protein Q9224_007418, partial [Gallowayella concinna]
ESYSPADAGIQNSYNTRSNKVRVIKTPGGKLQYQHLKKRGSPPKCGDCGIKLPGVRPKRKSFESFHYGHELWKMALMYSCHSGPGSPTSRIRHHLPTQENSTARLWWIKMCELRERQSCTGVSHRRAKDCEEGAQGKPAEEEMRKGEGGIEIFQ